MAKIIGLPKLSPTMEEGTLVRWVKNEGDAIQVDDLIAEVETDKATMEFRSFDKGVLLKHLVPEGTTLAPDQPVAIFGNAGEDVSALVAEAGSTPSAAEAPSADAADTASAAAAPVAITGSAATSGAAGATDAPIQNGGRVLASPLVRKLAREQDIDLTRVAGSGPGGRIIKRDLDGSSIVGHSGLPVRGPSLAPASATRRAAPSVPRGAAAGAAVPAVVTPVDVQDGRVEKLTQMRKTIARRLTESKQNVPHFYLNIDVDAEGLVEARAEINRNLAKRGEKISLNDLIIKACALGLRKVPACNASFNGDSIVYHQRVDISVAVAVEAGLVTPVVRGADQLGVLEISQAVRDMAGRAKNKKLMPEEMSNGTFSVSNLGMFGIDEFSAVINPPEGAILAISRVRDEPVVRDGKVVPGKRMALTMSCDHRVIDGATGAQFLQVLRGHLENPLNMIL